MSDFPAVIVEQTVTDHARLPDLDPNKQAVCLSVRLKGIPHAYANTLLYSAGRVEKFGTVHALAASDAHR
jgi:hypothetical protein